MVLAIDSDASAIHLPRRNWNTPPSTLSSSIARPMIHRLRTRNSRPPSRSTHCPSAPGMASGRFCPITASMVSASTSGVRKPMATFTTTAPIEPK